MLAFEYRLALPVRLLREQADWHPESSEEDDPAGEADWMLWQLREVANHAAGVIKGEHTLAEFADHYDLNPKE